MATGVRWVPGKVITIRDRGFTQRKFQRGHYADAMGNWVAAPSRGVRPSGGGAVGSGSTSSSSSSSSYGYHGLSDDEIEARANAYADSAIAAKQAAIERQRAA